MRKPKPSAARLLMTLAAALLLAWSTGAVANDETVHRVVYQCSEPGPEAYTRLLFSVAQLKGKYEDKVEIVVTCLGPGIHLLAKQPRGEVPDGALDKMVYLDLAGVKFHACGNTMDALGWGAADMHDFVTVVPIGAEDLMLLQEQGYAYLKW
jgi:intracellular sulfur oxidation DsrE/DsrF family protein